MKWRENLQRIEAVNVDVLVNCFKEFQAGQTRFLIAFRHPSPLDSFCLARLLWHEVPQTADELGIALTTPTHAHFLYDRGIPLWAGQGIGWLYGKLGGTPIQRGKVDRQGLRSARNLFINGQWPMAAAPEGGNNGHSEIVSPLEPGVAQLGFWCVEDLHKAGRTEQVLIVPLGITYRYVTPPWEELDRWLTRLEQDSGIVPHRPSTPAADIPSLTDSPDPAMQVRYRRLFQLGLTLLGVMEEYYHEVYGLPLGGAGPIAAGATANGRLGQRLQALLDAALNVAETYFQISPRGSAIDRCRRIEQAGWDRIFRQDLADDRTLSDVERGLADRVAEEASLRMWHMRLVENFVAVTGQYVQANPSAERFAETLLILRDTVSLVQGKNPFPRPQLGPQVATLQVGAPLDINQRWPDYRANRKQTVAQLTTDLQSALEAMVEDKL
jgi:1-acyl-sn-glycerol-3-phosphate acyltransferase